VERSAAITDAITALRSHALGCPVAATTQLEAPTSEQAAAKFGDSRRQIARSQHR
jgi:hypothetical protein